LKIVKVIALRFGKIGPRVALIKVNLNKLKQLKKKLSFYTLFTIKHVLFVNMKFIYCTFEKNFQNLVVFLGLRRYANPLKSIQIILKRDIIREYNISDVISNFYLNKFLP
jgi:hypothetical protein